MDYNKYAALKGTMDVNGDPVVNLSKNDDETYTVGFAQYDDTGTRIDDAVEVINIDALQSEANDITARAAIIQGVVNDCKNI